MIFVTDHCHIIVTSLSQQYCHQNICQLDFFQWVKSINFIIFDCLLKIRNYKNTIINSKIFEGETLNFRI